MKTWDGGVTLSQDCHKDRSSKKGNQIALWIDHASWCSTMLLSCYMFPIISLCLAVTNWAVDSCRCLDFKRSISLACYTAPPIPKRGWLAQEEEFIEMRHTEAQKRHEMEGKWSLALFDSFSTISHLCWKLGLPNLGCSKNAMISKKASHCWNPLCKKLERRELQYASAHSTSYNLDTGLIQA